MTQDTGQQGADNGGALAALRFPAFRRIWAGSLLSNLGHMILGVAAAWEMTRLSDEPEMVAMVQTALMLPLMLVAVPAGALADMFDRRKVALSGLAVATVGGMVLAASSFAGLVTPWFLLGMLVVIGSGVSLYSPAWQASIGELVPNEQLPAAVSLGSVAYNLARSFGPAIGGVIVLAAGAKAAFAVNAFGYLPLIVAFLVWQRLVASSRLPPETFRRAVVSGFRYAFNASGVRNPIVRSFVFGFAGATSTALAPLIARDQLGGDSSTFGLLLGASGVGAVLGSLMTSTARERLGPEIAVRTMMVLGGLALTGIGLASNLWLAVPSFALQGFSTMLAIAMLNVGVQLSAPRWVTARALSLFGSALTGGIALGAIAWGVVAGWTGLREAVLISAAMLAASALLGFVLPLRRDDGEQREQVDIGNQVAVGMALTPRSGPIVVEIDYRVSLADARAFYRAMQPIARARRRNGGFAWSLSRDIADPELWTERYVCPTWGDYLHMRDRFTQADREAQTRAEAFSSLVGDDRVRRRLERPSGSVRWRDDTPDTGQDSYPLIN